MPELVRRQLVGLSIMEQMQRELRPEYVTEIIASNDASSVAKQVVFLKIVRKRLRALLLPQDRRNCAIALPGRNAVIVSRLCESMINGDPPVSLAVLDQAAASAMGIGHFQVRQIFKAHSGSAQNQHCVPVHG